MDQGVSSRRKSIEIATEQFVKAFDRVMKMRSVEEDLDKAANTLIELGVQPFHVIRPTRAFKEPVQLEGEPMDRARSRLNLMRKIGCGDHRFEEELAKAVILEWKERCSSGPSFPGCRVVPDRETLTRMAALAQATKRGSPSGDMTTGTPLREGFLSTAYVRNVLKEMVGALGECRTTPTYRPGYQIAPASMNWSYWFDWLYFIMDHPTGERFYEPPQCMNCGRCLDDLGAQECPGCGEDPWQWWFQWFYARHAPEDVYDRSWDLFQLHTCTEGRIFHPRTEGWISSLTHVPLQEEGKFRLEVVSRAALAAPGIMSVAEGMTDLAIWHSVAFGPYPATSIRHPPYFDANGNPVQYAHRSPFEQLVMMERMGDGKRSVDVDMMPGIDRYSIRDPCLPWGEATIGVSTIRTADSKDGRERWKALTPIIEGPGAIIVREEVTYVLEDPMASGYRSISPMYSGQVGGWFELLEYRVVEEEG